MNPRPVLASVGPVLDDVRVDLGANGALAALLVSLPVVTAQNRAGGCGRGLI
ncbi:MAG TPA: hypothetical protein VF086_02490 [Propionibacteriaceae bacterium]